MISAVMNAMDLIMYALLAISIAVSAYYRFRLSRADEIPDWLNWYMSNIPTERVEHWIATAAMYEDKTNDQRRLMVREFLSDHFERRTGVRVPGYIADWIIQRAYTIWKKKTGAQ